jgi:hypothetical protein
VGKLSLAIAQKQLTLLKPQPLIKKGKLENFYTQLSRQLQKSHQKITKSSVNSNCD